MKSGSDRMRTSVKRFVSSVPSIACEKCTRQDEDESKVCQNIWTGVHLIRLIRNMAMSQIMHMAPTP